jgi:hypothetical protein
MNKRIKKKRETLRVYRVGNRVYTHKRLVMLFGKARIGYITAFEIYRKIGNPKLIRPRVKTLVNYVYKKHAESIARSGDIYLPFKHLRFARHLNEPNRVATSFASNSCEACAMEVD